VWEIVKIHECREAGLSKAATANRLSKDRGTVAKYWDDINLPLQKPTYQRSTKIDPYKDYIIARLEKWPELSADRIYHEIKRQGYNGSKRTVRRHVAKLRPQKMREYKPYETMPGEQAQVDWGHFGEIIENGRRKKLYAFVFCLSWSRISYVEFITSLNMAVFNGCLHRALNYVGGVPATILFDNAKTVVSERVGTAVRFNPELLETALAYGFTPKACWVKDPESKGKVESNVKYVRRGFYYAREFDNLADLNDQARTWLAEIANARVHGTTGCIPQERHKEERQYLKPLPSIERPLPVFETRKATKTAIISVDNNKYSVPARLARKTIHYRRYEDKIEILDKNKNTIAEHILVSGKNQLVINDAHYPEHSKPNKRPRNALQARFEALAPQAPEYLQKLSQRREGHLRDQMQNIIALAEQYRPEEMSAAMQRALEYGAIGYARLKAIIQKQTKIPQSLPDNPQNKRKALLDLPCKVQVQRRDTSYYGGVTS
jgi:transposase